jgi:hypothetical protein
MNMHAKIQYDNMHGFVWSNSLRLELVDFYIAHYLEKGDEVKFIGHVWS